MKTILLYGQLPPEAGPDEQDVLVQIDSISAALRELGHETVPLALSLNLQATKEELLRQKPDLVFNLVESVNGSGRMISLGPLLLEELNIPYTGAKADAMFFTSNKILTKRMLAREGVPTAPWLESGDDLRHIGPKDRYLIKSVWEHASCGLADDALIEGNPDLIRERLKRSSCFAEAYIEGREFNLAILAGPGGPEFLPPSEILFEDYPPEKLRIVCYRAKWIEDSFEYSHTPRTFKFRKKDHAMLSHMKELALHCWNVFHLTGYARVDFRVDPSGKPWVLEINANPCLSPDGGFAAAARHSGLSYREVIRRLVEEDA